LDKAQLIIVDRAAGDKAQVEAACGGLPIARQGLINVFNHSPLSLHEASQGHLGHLDDTFKCGCIVYGRCVWAWRGGAW